MASSATGKLRLSNMVDVRNALFEVRSKWEDIGLDLLGNKADIDAIKRERGDNTAHCLTDMLSVYLKRVNPEPSWSLIIAALKTKAVGEYGLAQDLERIYLPISVSSPRRHDLPTAVSPRHVELADFPYLDIGELSTHERLDLVQRLSRDYCFILKKFAVLEAHACKSLVRQNISAEMIANSAVSLALFKSDDVPRPLLAVEEEESLKEAKTIDRIFILLRRYKLISYFNYGILEHIIEIHGTEDDKSMLKEYTNAFETFCHRMVFECPPITSEYTHRCFKAILTTDMIKTLDDISAAERKIADIVGLHHSVLMLHAISIGGSPETSSPTRTLKSNTLSPPPRAQLSQLKADDTHLKNMEQPAIGKPSIFPSNHFSKEKHASVPFLYHTILEIDHHGREYTNIDHGITLRVPKGAVAADEKVHLEFGVAMYGPFKFPPNMLPISPIVWLCPMEEKIDLKNPFEIEMPHIHKELSEKDIQRLEVCFAKADHGGLLDVDGRKHYRFAGLKNAVHVSFQPKCRGVLQTKHFCYLCVIENRNPEVMINADYCLARVTVRYSETSPPRHVFHFYAIFDLPTCRKALEDSMKTLVGKYSELKYATFRFQCDKEQAATQQPQMYLRVVNPSPSDQRDMNPKPYQSTMDPILGTIIASEIDFRDKESEVLQERQEKGLYPPRIKMTILSEPTKTIVLPLRFEGCTEDSNLDGDLVLPLDVPSIPFPGVNTAPYLQQPLEVQFGQMRMEPAGPMFSVDMSDNDLKVFLQSEGLRDGDCSKLIDNGIGAKIFTDLTEDDIQDPELGLSFGARKVVKKILDKYKSGGYSSAIGGPISRMTSSGLTGSYLSTQDLDVVYTELLEARNEWYNIGLKIKVNPSQLDSIKEQYRGKSEECFRSVLHIFLRKANPKPTWNLLVDALESEPVGYGQLAETIHNKFNV